MGKRASCGRSTIQVMHDSPRECIKYVTGNGLNIYEDGYDRIRRLPN